MLTGYEADDDEGGDCGIYIHCREKKVFVSPKLLRLKIPSQHESNQLTDNFQMDCEGLQINID